MKWSVKWEFSTYFLVKIPLTDRALLTGECVSRLSSHGVELCEGGRGTTPGRGSERLHTHGLYTSTLPALEWAFVHGSAKNNSRRCARSLVFFAKARTAPPATIAPLPFDFPAANTPYARTYQSITRQGCTNRGASCVERPALLPEQDRARRIRSSLP